MLVMLTFNGFVLVYTARFCGHIINSLDKRHDHYGIMVAYNACFGCNYRQNIFTLFFFHNSQKSLFSGKNKSRHQKCIYYIQY